ncbi:unnamed protein product (macronuclear) [Paramecium tetraurelia]|uniref:SP-RING-type domain-containing protein n=1 Tax=Paramecium tetraurelia TaxID=5888 RepID=A0E627_PARTE|nr:uncharacterized protein GSPATT00003607001 [Paramecium tetraurelia]CAK90744.1 unnamed protein product [Paramecium tetraurelia]|eukprot:XP_001458141.1 hypothetical protein (macronuclear) [Paramecium tetraurelia strain d4-2]
MEHKKLLENVMIDLLKDPTCPIYQYQDWQLTNICYQLQLQNFSNIKDQDFQRKFAQFFINYLEAENEIENILEQSSIKRSDFKKNNVDRSQQKNQGLQKSNKEKKDQIDTPKNKKKVKLKQSNPFEIEENPCAHNPTNLDLKVPQDQKLSQCSFDPLNDNHHDKNISKEKTQKSTSNEQVQMEDLNERKDKDNNQECNQKQKNNNINDFNNQKQSHQITKPNDKIETKKQLQVQQKNDERENNRVNDNNKTNDSNSRKSRQIQIKKKPSRAIIDTSPEEDEFVIQISDSESLKKRNIQELRNTQGKHQMDDLIQNRKAQQSDHNQRSKILNPQQNLKNMNFNQKKLIERPIISPLIEVPQFNQNSFQSIGGIELQIQKQKQLLENQFNIIQSQPAYQKPDNYSMNVEKNNLNNSLTNTSNCIIQQKNSFCDFQNMDSAPLLNPLHETPKESSKYVAQNLQIHKNDYLGVNLERNNHQPKQNLQYWNQNQFPYQLQSHIQSNQLPNQLFYQPNIYPQSNRIFEGGQNLEFQKDQKPKLETYDVTTSGNVYLSTQNKSLQIKTNRKQCNYCKQIDGKVKLIDIEDDIKICSSCLLEKLNPFKKIIFSLGFLEYQYQQKSQSKIHLEFTITQEQFLIPGIQLEIRCVVMNQNGLTDFTFPNYCILLINGQTIKEFRPLIDKSCLKKRKDHCISINLDFLQKTCGIYKKYTFTCVEMIPDSQMRQEIPKQIYIFGLYLVQNQSLDSVIHSIVNQSIMSQIKVDFCKNEIKVDKSKVSLICQYSFDLMKIPARGEFCQHQQCFSLNNYLDMMIHAEHMKWICPICKKNCISLRIDQYQWEILKKIQQLNVKVDSIIVDQNGSLDIKDPLYPIIQNTKINSYGDLIQHGYTHFERSLPQFDNDNEIISQDKFQPQGENEINAILID